MKNSGNVIPFRKKKGKGGRKRKQENALFIQRANELIDKSENHEISREQLVEIFTEVFPAKTEKLKKFLTDGQPLSAIWSVPKGVHRFVVNLKSKKKMRLFGWHKETDMYCRYAKPKDFDGLLKARDVLDSKKKQAEQFINRNRSDSDRLDKKEAKMNTRKQRDKYYESQPGGLF